MGHALSALSLSSASGAHASVKSQRRSASTCSVSLAPGLWGFSASTMSPSTSLSSTSLLYICLPRYSVQAESKCRASDLSPASLMSMQ